MEGVEKVEERKQIKRGEGEGGRTNITVSEKIQLVGRIWKTRPFFSNCQQNKIQGPKPKMFFFTVLKTVLTPLKTNATTR